MEKPNPTILRVKQVCNEGYSNDDIHDGILDSDREILNNDTEVLDVIKKSGTRAAPTDLAVLLGTYMLPFQRTNEGDFACDFWAVSSYNYQSFKTKPELYVPIVSCYGNISKASPFSRNVSIRPALLENEAAKITPTAEWRSYNGIHIVEYGEYPQTVVNEDTANILETLYNVEQLEVTGKNYTFDGAALKDEDAKFKPDPHPEYTHQGKKYVRVIARPESQMNKLSDGKDMEEGKAYWVEVQPIEWMKDKSGILISRKCLLAGIQYDTKPKYTGNFGASFIKYYLNTYFMEEMQPSKINEIEPKTIGHQYQVTQKALNSEVICHTND